MLPQTPYVRQGKGERPVPHEPITDLPVHPATRQQLFIPVSESRNFTREDAARAFDDTLLTADKRIPHPELVIVERERLAGISNEERVRLAAARMELEKKRMEGGEEDGEGRATSRVCSVLIWELFLWGSHLSHDGRSQQAQGKSTGAMRKGRWWR